MNDKWIAVATPPKDMLKKIPGGRLKGMTDIKPQWRYQIMTEVYGMCGVGWKYDIVRLWTEPASDGQVFAFAQVNVYTNEDGEGWSDAIPGTGGSMLVTKESAGLHSSDEGFKMAVTDAIGTALKMIGVASEVYMGHAGDSKYGTPTIFPKPAEKKATFLDMMALQHDRLGDSIYTSILVDNGYFTAEEITDRNAQGKIYKLLESEKGPK